MKNETTKRFTLPKIIAKLQEYEMAVERKATLALVVATVFLILATISLTLESSELTRMTNYSANIAKDLGNIQLYLSLERQKQDVLDKQSMTFALAAEILYNKKQLTSTRDALFVISNTTEGLSDILSVDVVQQARKMTSFGNFSISISLADYNVAINLVKEDIAEINRDVVGSDWKIRTERINSAIGVIGILLNQSQGTNNDAMIDKVLNDLRGYSDTLSADYRALDDKTKSLLVNI